MDTGTRRWRGCSDKAAEDGASAFEPGDVVEIVGLTGRPELNGQTGELGEFHPDKERWAVKLANRPAVLLQSCNIRDGTHLM